MEKIADVLYEAPFAIIAHNRFAPNVPDEESVFTYANKACTPWLVNLVSRDCPARQTAMLG